VVSVGVQNYSSIEDRPELVKGTFLFSKHALFTLIGLQAGNPCSAYEKTSFPA
jgi:hypothetical protein